MGGWGRVWGTRGPGRGEGRDGPGPRPRAQARAPGSEPPGTSGSIREAFRKRRRGLREASGRPPGDLWAGPGFVTFGSGKDNNCWGAFRVSLGGLPGEGSPGPSGGSLEASGSLPGGPRDVILGTGKITALGGAFGTFPLFPPLPASLRGRGPGSGPPGPGPGARARGPGGVA